MSRYFFDVDLGKGLARDEEGTELADEHAALDEATRAMGELAKDFLPKSEPQKNITMWVRDEHGEPLLQLALTFAVKPLRG